MAISFPNDQAYIWASNSRRVGSPTKDQIEAGFEFLGQATPSVELFNYIMRRLDTKSKTLLDGINNYILTTDAAIVNLGKADTALSNRITDEFNARVSADNSLNQGITSLLQRISTEESNRYNADQALSTRIAQEIQDRNNQDIAINNAWSAANIERYNQIVAVNNFANLVESRRYAMHGWAVYGGSVTPQSTNNSYVFTVPNDVFKIKVTVVGGGGAGGCGGQYAAAGGGAGGVASGWYPTQPGYQYAVSVGFGAWNGTDPYNPGWTGGGTRFIGAQNTPYYIDVYATGGQGGSSGSMSTVSGGAPGSGVTGQLLTAGGYGNDGSFNQQSASGVGGSGPYGGGGRSSQQGSGGIGGSGCGAGGGGSWNGQGNGGTGSPGLVIVEW